MHRLIQDIHYAVRQLRKTLGITLVAVLSLALGIGANTAIFSLKDTVMLKSLPVKKPSQLVLFGNGLDQGISDGFPNTWLYSYPFLPRDAEEECGVLHIASQSKGFFFGVNLRIR